MPFTVEEFLNIFREYNEAVFPAQWALLFFAVAAIVLSFARAKLAGRVVAIILASLWVWMGVVYHVIFFSSINPAAYLFGSLCIVQAGIFLYHGVVRGRMAISPAADTAGSLGAVLIIFALVVYPVLGYIFGHVYPYSPTFGAPCPTTIFTFGILLWDRNRVPVHVIAIPFIWSLIGFTAALTLTIYEDMGLLVAGLIGVSIIAWRNWYLGKASLTSES